MPSTKQVTVFLENKPGRLANVLAALAKEKVNITALTVMDHKDQAVLRLVTEDGAKTLQVLRGLNMPTSETDVLLVELRNHPGALANVCGLLGAEHINIDYCYCSSGGRNGKVFGVFKVSNSEKAQKLVNGSAKKPERRPLRDQRTYAR